MRRNALKPDRPPSVITTINQGFQAINRRPWIVLIPLVLDLLLWLGPRISPQPWLGQLLTAQPALAEQLAPYIEEQRALGIPFDLRTSASLVGTVRSLISPVWVAPAPFGAAAWHIGSGWELLGAALLINGIALVLTALYLSQLSDLLRTPATPTGGWLGRGARAVGRLVAVALSWVALVVVTFLPFLLVGAGLMLVSQLLGSVVIVIGLTVVFWLAFTAYFAFDAAVLGNLRPGRALLSSVSVVRSSFWSVIALLVLSWLIFTGLGVVWQAIAGLGWPGVLVGMLGSAYVATGLAAAHLVFYRDRVVDPATNFSQSAT